MTANEQALEFIDLLDKTSSGSAPGMEDEQISYALSQATEEFIKTRYSPKSNHHQEGYEQSEKRRKDLAQLTKNKVILAQDINNLSFFHSANNKPNGNFWFLPEDFLWAVNEEIVWEVGGCYDNLRIEVVPKTHDEYNRAVRNTFTKPSDKLVFRLDYSSEYSINDKNYFRLGVNTNSPVNGEEYFIEISSRKEGYIVISYLANSSTTWLQVLSGLALEVTNLNNSLIAVVDSSKLTLTINGDIDDIISYNIEYNSGIIKPIIEVEYDYQIHELITHGWDIKEYHVRYVRLPKDIVVDTVTPANQVHCELNASTHREIIKIAVTNTLAALEDPRYNIAVQENLTNE